MCETYYFMKTIVPRVPDGKKGKGKESPEIVSRKVKIELISQGSGKRGNEERAIVTRLSRYTLLGI